LPKLLIAGKSLFEYLAKMLVWRAPQKLIHEL
jgi:hypothetical protein